MKNKDKIKQELIELQDGGDIELCHVEADDLLCELLINLGYKDVVDEYKKVPKWYA